MEDPKNSSKFKCFINFKINLRISNEFLVNFNELCIEYEIQVYEFQLKLMKMN